MTLFFGHHRRVFRFCSALGDGAAAHALLPLASSLFVHRPNRGSLCIFFFVKVRFNQQAH